MKLTYDQAKAFLSMVVECPNGGSRAGSSETFFSAILGEGNRPYVWSFDTETSPSTKKKGQLFIDYLRAVADALEKKLEGS